MRIADLYLSSTLGFSPSAPAYLYIKTTRVEDVDFVQETRSSHMIVESQQVSSDLR